MVNLSEKLYCLKIESGKQAGYVIEEMLYGLEFSPTTWEEADLDYISHNNYYETREEAEEKCLEIKTFFEAERELWGIEGDVTFSVQEIEKEDWSEVWKKFFHTRKVSNRFVIKPSWEDYLALDDELVLEIDPGMSFGTGQHGTTQACLQFMDDLCAEKSITSVLDAGTGSGILSLGAAKLGITTIDAFDYDAEALRIAKENLELAKVDDIINLEVADVYNWQPKMQYDLVIANILCVVLIDVVETLKSAVKPGGYLILAGILDEQYAALRETYLASGFKELRNTQIKEWTSGLFILE